MKSNRRNLKMLLYHISKDLNHNGVFEPRIPEIRMKGENEWIERICFSKTIEGCFTAIPEGGQLLEKGIFRLFVLDTEKAGLNADDIIDSDELYKQNYVGDADITGETWVLKKVTFETYQDIYLKHWWEEVADVIPHYIMELSEEDEYEGDYLTAYIENIEIDEFDDEPVLVPSIVLITDAEIIYNEFVAGDSFSSDGFFEEEIVELINRNPETEFQQEKYGDIKIVKGTLNVTELSRRKELLIG